METFILLGRHGDILNLMPLAYKYRDVGTQWIVGEDFAPTLEGASYITPLKYPGGPDALDTAIHHAKLAGYSAKVAQVWRNPDTKRTTRSYNLESWRLVDHLLDYGQHPLVIDNRDFDREWRLKDRVFSRLDHRPIVLVATEATSSPFRFANRLIGSIRGLDVNVVDLCDVRADRVFDMLSLLERAVCLVTVDTLHLHLAKAAYCPVIALQADGWFGSILPAQTTDSWSYREANLEGVVNSVRNILSRRTASGIVLASDIWGDTERHKKAQETWTKRLSRATYRRSAKQIGDSRELHYMKDVLWEAMETQEGEIIVWVNDDTGFTPSGLSTIIEHAKKFNFGCVRRDPEHIGRECFWFTRSWLRRHIQSFPDVILCAPKCDLVIAKWLRQFLKLPTSLESMQYDFAPIDLPPGVVYHERHESSWLNYQASPSAVHNERLWNTL